MRINVDEINRVWRNLDLRHIKVDYQVDERAVLQPNEDTITLAVGAAERALEHAGVDSLLIDVVDRGAAAVGQKSGQTLIPCWYRY